jgi:hypothetical protein
LLEEFARRAKAGTSEFLLLIPGRRRRSHQDWTPEVALRLIKRCAARLRDQLTNAVAASPLRAFLMLTR